MTAHATCTHDATPQDRAACRKRKAEIDRLRNVPHVWNVLVLLEDSGGVWREARFMRADDEYYDRIKPGADHRGEYAIMTRNGCTFTVTADRMKFIIN